MKTETYISGSYTELNEVVTLLINKGFTGHLRLDRNNGLKKYILIRNYKSCDLGLKYAFMENWSHNEKDVLITSDEFINNPDKYISML